MPNFLFEPCHTPALPSVSCHCAQSTLLQSCRYSCVPKSASISVIGGRNFALKLIVGTSYATWSTVTQPVCVGLWSTGHGKSFLCQKFQKEKLDYAWCAPFHCLLLSWHTQWPKGGIRRLARQSHLLEFVPATTSRQMHNWDLFKFLCFDCLGKQEGSHAFKTFAQPVGHILQSPGIATVLCGAHISYAVSFSQQMLLPPTLFNFQEACQPFSFYSSCQIPFAALSGMLCNMVSSLLTCYNLVCPKYVANSQFPP